jgi:predicted dinucleotide-binding enzyme
MRTTKIGVIGSGDVGKALARGFAATGHDVKIGSREPAKLKEVAAGRITAGTFADAAEFGEIVVLATSWSGTENALELAGKSRFKGKIVLDATNPLKVEGGKAVGLERGHTDSGGELVQRWLSEAKVVKVFNSVGNGIMFKPELAGGPPDMFFCGNDEGAKKVATEILKDFGWNPIDIDE